MVPSENDPENVLEEQEGSLKWKVRKVDKQVKPMVLITMSFDSKKGQPKKRSRPRTIEGSSSARKRNRTCLSGTMESPQRDDFEMRDAEELRERNESLLCRG
ncbi:hypothetical protein M5689_014663 [Euphorbia peplus]|nr:hypothetical protein M5689_014663 [Euphorbia peplus]